MKVSKHKGPLFCENTVFIFKNYVNFDLMRHSLNEPLSLREDEMLMNEDAFPKIIKYKIY